MSKRLTRSEQNPDGGAPGQRALAAVEEFDIGAKIRALRLDRRLTLQDVARETGFSSALISQIENNNVSPPIATLARIAHALRVKVSYFFDSDNTKGRFEVVRPAERRRVDRVMSRLGTKQGYTYEALAFRVRSRKMTPFLLIIAKDSEPRESLYTHEGEEFLFVLAGRAALEVGEEHFTLEAGDSVYLDSSLKHRLLREGEEEAKVLAIICR